MYIRTYYVPNGGIFTPINVYKCDVTQVEFIECDWHYKYGDNVHISEKGLEQILEDYINLFSHKYPTGYPLIIKWLQDRFCQRIKRYAYIPNKLKKEVLLKFKHTCNYCGSKDKLEIDHIYPVDKGGLSEIKNLQVLCSKCNRKKSNKILPECQK
jgi:hypothetical protein